MNKNICLHILKTLREDRTAEERKMLLSQPAAGGEYRKRHSLI